TGDIVGTTDLDSSKRGILQQLQNSPTVRAAYNPSLAFPSAGVEPTINAGLVALGVDFVKFNDDRGVPKVYGTIVAGFFIDKPYLQNQIGQTDTSTNMSIVTSIRLLASTLPANVAQRPTNLLDGRQGEKIVDQVFTLVRSP